MSGQRHSHVARVEALKRSLETCTKIGEDLRVLTALVQLADDDPERWGPVLDRYKVALVEVRDLLDEIGEALKA
jgi:hypothetical protein